jgi:hypothetical protein
VNIFTSRLKKKKKKKKDHSLVSFPVAHRSRGHIGSSTYTL